GAFAEFALDLNFSIKPLHDTIDHGQPKARAPFALGREERFQTVLARLLIHADARVADFQDYVRREPSPGPCDFPTARPRAHDNTPAIRNRIYRVEDQIGQRLSHFALDANQLRQARIKFLLHFHHHAAPLRNVAPARPG